MKKVLIVGGGAAGMMASIVAARRGFEVHVFEKNEKPGKKLYITGKGRCNLTNDCDVEELISNTVSNSRFMYSAFYGFSSRDAVSFFENEGLKLKTERGNRVFPVSDKSADVLDALKRAMKKSGVRLHLNSEVKGLVIEDVAADGTAGGEAGSKKRGSACVVRGITPASGENVKGDAVIVATGGLSYPMTGSTGDGYRFAKKTGHHVTQCIPSLVPFNVREEYVKELQGLSLKNVEVSIYDGDKCIFRQFGEMMFTHFGVSGPLILTAGAMIGRKAAEKELRLTVDLKPALDRDRLDRRFIRELEKNRNKNFINAAAGVYPAKLTPVMVDLSGIDPYKKARDITREERLRIVGLTKALPMTVTGLRGYNEAVITKGGVSVKDINPSTMESKLVKGLYFIGEVLDVDALTGGFNLQIAWSTAHACATSL